MDQLGFRFRRLLKSERHAAHTSILNGQMPGRSTLWDAGGTVVTYQQAYPAPQWPVWDLVLMCEELADMLSRQVVKVTFLRASFGVKDWPVHQIGSFQSSEYGLRGPVTQLDFLLTPES
jgi:hypothetical protein